MTRRFVAVVCGLQAFSLQVAMADVFNMPSGLTNLEMIEVGNPGNAGEASGGGFGTSWYYGPLRTCGAVDYVYNIGKFEVTAGQYCEFLNAVAKTDTYGLYNTNMWSSTYEGCKIQRSGTSGNYAYSVASDWANRPVNLVTWGDAARFANWLANGQPTGAQGLSTTEDGSYYLNGATESLYLARVPRKANATWVIPSEDEWYKAAYYDANKPGGAGYWDYATRSNLDTNPSNVLDPSGTNNANFSIYPSNYTIGNPYWRTPVGAFAGSPSPYGTFDQCGNVAEWNEARGFQYSTARGIRGGCYVSELGGLFLGLDSMDRWEDEVFAADQMSFIGFRVAVVPEPATLSVLALGGLALLRKRR